MYITKATQHADAGGAEAPVPATFSPSVLTINGEQNAGVMPR